MSFIYGTPAFGGFPFGAGDPVSGAIAVSVTVVDAGDDVAAVGVTATVASGATPVGVTVTVLDLGDDDASIEATVSSLIPAASIRPWADFIPALTLVVPDCPVFVMDNAIRRAAIDIYTRTRAWRIEKLTLATTIAGQQDYAAPTPVNAALVGLPAVWVGGAAVAELQPGVSDGFAPAASGSAKAVGVIGAAVIRVVPVPETTGLAVVATAAYAPTEAAIGINADLYRLHHRAIEYQALAYLLMMRDKPWSDPRGAMFNQSMADGECAFDSAMAGPISTRSALRVQPL